MECRSYKVQELYSLKSSKFMCPACVFEFGVTDKDLGYTFEQWRQKWIAGGMLWDEGDSEPPEGWNPIKQLQNLVK